MRISRVRPPRLFRTILFYPLALSGSPTAATTSGAFVRGGTPGNGVPPYRVNSGLTILNRQGRPRSSQGARLRCLLKRSLSLTPFSTEISSPQKSRVRIVTGDAASVLGNC
jgi:hypothetical protein